MCRILVKSVLVLILVIELKIVDCVFANETTSSISSNSNKISLSNSSLVLSDIKNETTKANVNVTAIPFKNNATVTNATNVKKLDKLSPNLKAENKKNKQTKTTKASSTIVQKLATKKSKVKTTSAASTTKRSNFKVVLKKVVTQKSTKKQEKANATIPTPTIKSVLLESVLRDQELEKLHGKESMRIFGKNFQQILNAKLNLNNLDKSLNQMNFTNSKPIEKNTNHSFLHRNFLLSKNYGYKLRGNASTDEKKNSSLIFRPLIVSKKQNSAMQIKSLLQANILNDKLIKAKKGKFNFSFGSRLVQPENLDLKRVKSELLTSVVSKEDDERIHEDSYQMAHSSVLGSSLLNDDKL